MKYMTNGLFYLEKQGFLEFLVAAVLAISGPMWSTLRQRPN